LREIDPLCVKFTVLINEFITPGVGIK